jgi:hypothetical protein
MIVNNSTNISKTNNHLSPSHTEHTQNKKKTMTYEFGNPSPGFGQVHRCDGIKQVNEIPNISY